MPDDAATAATVAPPLAAGALLAPGYAVMAHLHRSRYLDIYQAWSEERTCNCVAKVLRPDRRDDRGQRRDLVREGRLLRRLTHQHLVHAYDVRAEPEPVVILEALTGPTLASHLTERRRRLPLADVVCIGIGLSSAANYLHRRGMLHLDINPTNVIMEGPVAKVIDLSLARPPGRGRRRWGTDAYMAPEQARGGDFSAATDAWGIGATLFEVATGQQAFPYDEERNIHMQLERRAEPIRARRRVPLAFAAIVDGCLDPDPARRPAIAAILHALLALDESGVGSRESAVESER